MKTPLTKTWIVIGLTCASVVHAAEPNPSRSNGELPPPSLSSERISSEHLGLPSKASELIGKSVTNLEGKTLGKIDDIAIDLESGRVSLVLVSSGGFLGLGSKDFAVPPRAFKYDSDSKTLRLDIDKAKFKAAPPFEKSKWEDQVRAERVRETYAYYGQELYPGKNSYSATVPSRNEDNKEVVRPREGGKVENRLDADNNRPAVTTTGASRFEDKTNAPVVIGWLNKASAVIGMPVVNMENQRCGQIDNMIVDLETGRIVHLIISSGGVLGIGDTLNVVPPGAVHYNAARDAIQINMTKEQLAAAPNFKASDWPNFGDPAYSGKVYRAYGVEPYFTTDADNTARNVHDRQGRLSPLDQGQSEADIKTTRLIRQQLNEREGASVNARNVKVITINGRVTLRGPVNTEEEKAWIAEVAKKHASSGEVENQLEVKRDSTNN